MKRREIIETYIEPSVVAMQVGNIDKAISILQDGLADTNNDGQLALRLADIFYNQKKYRKAADLYQTAALRLGLGAQKIKAQERLAKSTRELLCSGPDSQEFFIGLHKEYGRGPGLTEIPWVELSCVKIRRLFGLYDYDIAFKQDAVTILAGANGVGKSTVLKLISALYHWDLEYIARVQFESCEYKFFQYLQELPDKQEISSIVIKRKKARTKTSNNNEAVVLTVSLVNPQGRTQRTGRVLVRLSNKQLNSSRDTAQKTDNAINSKSPKRLLSLENEPEWLVPFLSYRGAFYLGANRLESYVKDAFPGLTQSDGPAIIKYAEYMKHIIASEKIPWYAMETFPERKALFCSLINNRLVDKELVLNTKAGFQVRNKLGHIFDLATLSSGEQHLINLFFILLFNSGYMSRWDHPYPPIVMIDEPELSLHVAWQTDFVSDLEKIIALVSGTYIIATHSPSIVHNSWNCVVELGINQNGAEK